MFCRNCGKELEDGWVNCPCCGFGISDNENTRLKIQEKNVLDDKEQMNEKVVIQGQLPHYIHERIEYRNFWKYVILSFVTCGIYGVYILCGYVKDINRICEGDGQESNSYITVFLLTAVTGGIYGIYWWYIQSERLYRAALKYGIKLRENGKSILLWLIPANIIMLGGGTLIANYIMFDNMNLIAKIYNEDISKKELQKAKNLHPNLIQNVWTIYGILLLVGVLLIVAIVNSFSGKMEGIGEQREDAVYDQKVNTGGHDGVPEDMYIQDNSDAESVISEKQTIIPTPALPSIDYTGHYLSMETGDMSEFFINQQGSESSGKYELRIDMAEQYNPDEYYSGFFYGEYCKKDGFEGIMHSGPMDLYYYKNGDIIDRVTLMDQSGKIYVKNEYLYWDWCGSDSDISTVYKFQKLDDEYVESKTTRVPYDGDYSEAADQYQSQIDFAGKYTDTFSETAEMIIAHSGSDYGIEICEENFDGTYSKYHFSGFYNHYTNMLQYSGYVDIVEILSDGDKSVISTESGLYGTIYYRDGYLYLNCDNGDYYETTFKKLETSMVTPESTEAPQETLGTMDNKGLFIGRWQDTWSKRATMEITMDDGKLHLYVQWANSAADGVIWNFVSDEGFDPEYGTIGYYGSRYEWNEQHPMENPEQKSSDEHGVFKLEANGCLRWYDNSDYSNCNCIFEKIAD